MERHVKSGGNQRAMQAFPLGAHASTWPVVFVMTGVRKSLSLICQISRIDSLRGSGRDGRRGALHQLELQLQRSRPVSFEAARV